MSPNNFSMHKRLCPEQSALRGAGERGRCEELARVPRASRRFDNTPRPILLLKCLLSSPWSE